MTWDAKPEVVLVGAIAGAFGVRGEVRIKSFTATPEDIFDYAPFCDEHGRVIVSIQSWRHIKDGFAAYLVEVTSREDAVALKSTKLHARRQALPPAADEEYYHADLIDLKVRDLSDQPLGRVKAIHNFGADDLLEIHRTPGVKQSWYLPFTKQMTPHIDLAKGVIIADPAPGLLPNAPDEEEIGEEGMSERGDG